MKSPNIEPSFTIPPITFAVKTPFATHSTINYLAELPTIKVLTILIGAVLVYKRLFAITIGS